MFIDTHAHIYSKEFDTDLGDMLARTRASGVEKIFMPNIDSDSVERMIQIADEYPFCHPMIGLHPCHVKENYLEELAFMENWLSKREFAAIGEIGIDLYWDVTFAKEQEIAFRHQISTAKSAGLPFVIHSRDSLDLTVKIVEELQDGDLRGIFHCFNGTVEQAKRIVNSGFLMGIGGVITYKNAGMDKVLEHLDLIDMVLETDAPYLSPVPYRGKRNESSYIPTIAARLAEIKNVDINEVASITSENALRLFKIHFR
ncbi:MAG: TatD family hydrolase [Saprospiraceae bacterium]|jgi:TatD DNase family protein|nr:TatD family hydrolase [Saprospiraceae bacterium]